MGKKVDTLLTQILDTAGLVVTEDNCVSIPVRDATGKEKREPLTIKGQRLVLPSENQMSNPNWEGRVAMNPFVENSARSESIVMERLRLALNTRLNTIIPTMLIELLQLAASRDDHAKLNPEQSKVLSILKYAKDETIEAFKNITKRMPAGQPTKQFVSIYVKKSGKVNGEAFFRVGVASFPFYEEMLDDEHKPHGVKLNKKDHATILAALEFILPNQGQVGFYNRGSNAHRAPTIQAVMATVRGIAEQLNSINKLFSNVFKTDLEIPLDWVEGLEDLDDLANELRDIGMLDGNDGATPEAKSGVAPSAPVHTPAAVAPSVSVQSQNTGGGVDIMTALQPKPQPVYVPQPVLYGGVPQQPQIIREAGGVTIVPPPQPFGGGFGQPAYGAFGQQAQSPHAGRASPNNPVGYSAPQGFGGFSNNGFGVNNF